MSRPIALLAVGMVLLAVGRAQDARSTIDLLKGRDFGAWEFVTTPSASVSMVCTYNTDGSVAVSGKPVGYLATKKSYADYRLHAEWRWPKDPAKNSNGGILLHIASGPKDRAWPVCFQVQTKPTRVGDLLPMAGAVFAEPLTSPADAPTPQRERRGENSERPLGEWNTCDIVCRDGTVEITINGVLQNKVTDVNPGAGKIGFQLEGTPYELRNVRLEVLD